MRYAAFISYNHKDVKAARWLHRALETYRLPRHLRGRESAFGPLADRLPPIFQDREELAASSNLAASVQQALKESHSLVVICSPHSARSRWVNEEIREFTRLGRRDRIQCLIVSGMPNASTIPGADASLECLPPALFEDGGEEPLASDIRPGQDGRAAARLKLIAGILAVPYDELRQREHARRQKRLMIVAVASAIGFLVMAALTMFALISRREAIAQRDIARERTVTAERTVEFVQSLFEVSDPSEARGAKITAQEVLDKGADRIRNTLSDEPNVKAQLMTTLSQVYLGLGAYRRGETIIADSMKLKVTDPTVRARQLMGLASSAYRQGDYAKAVTFYKSALPLAERDPTGGTELKSTILAGIGDASSRAGDTSGGAAGMRLALQLDTARYGPRSVQVARDLEALGVYEQARENYPQARRYYERAVDIRLATQGISHPLVSDDLNELGTIAYLQNDPPAAQRFWSKALQSDLMVLGPDHPDVAYTTANLARVLLEQRRFADARQLMERAIEVTMRNRSETNDSLAFLYANLGLALRGQGEMTDAIAAFTRALRVAEMTKHRNLGPVVTELGDLYCSTGQAEKGLSLLERAEAVTRADYPGDAWREAWVTNTKGSCLVAAGRASAGSALLRASMAPLRERWSAGSLYRVLAEDRLKAAGDRSADEG